VQLDIASIFQAAALPISAVTEVSLTNNQLIAAIDAHRQESLAWTSRENAVVRLSSGPSVFV
jgi:hypothetical protein